MFGSFVPQYCKWVDILHGVGLEMVVQVFEWGWIYEMDVVEAVVVVEVGDRDSMELGMEDTEENIEDIMYFSHKVLSNLVSKTGFWVEMAKVDKEGVCLNDFEMDVNKLEIF